LGQLLYAEDLVVGSTYQLGEYEVSAEEIVSFASQWDPQPFHTDPEFATGGFFGGLIASGLHTQGIFHRLAVLGVYRDWAIIAGRRIRDVALPAPVRPGSVLSGQISIDEMTPTAPDRCLMVTRGRLTSGQTPVLEGTFETYIRRRPRA
jgi:acyl dehydratase